MPISIDDQIKLLARRCERILNEDDLRRKLQLSASTGQPLRIKLGMDPTAPDVTLGHAVPLQVVRQFQDWGHKAVLIIGDYTARVGDPSGRNTTRPVLSGEQIDANARTYVAQVGKILLTDIQHLEVRFNGEWLGKMGLVDIIRLAARKTLAQVLQRDDFAKRYQDGIDIRLHELVYPLLQGWDSVMIDADVEMGGSDQLFNNLVGREFQKEDGKDGQVVIVTPLLIGTDGAIKMSKSKGNYIGVTDPPSGSAGMFGKIMSLPDNLMDMYYTLVTNVPADEFRPLIQSSPRDAKVRLAKTIVAWLHGPDAADAAEREFQTVVVDHGMPQDMPEFRLPPQGLRLPNLLKDTGLVPSTSEAARKIKEGAVRINGEKETRADLTTIIRTPNLDKIVMRVPYVLFDEPFVLQLGNRKFVRVLPE